MSKLGNTPSEFQAVAERALRRAFPRCGRARKSGELNSGIAGRQVEKAGAMLDTQNPTPLRCLNLTAFALHEPFLLNWTETTRSCRDSSCPPEPLSADPSIRATVERFFSRARVLRAGPCSGGCRLRSFRRGNFHRAHGRGSRGARDRAGASRRRGFAGRYSRWECCRPRG